MWVSAQYPDPCLGVGPSEELPGAARLQPPQCGSGRIGTGRDLAELLTLKKKEKKPRCLLKTLHAQLSGRHQEGGWVVTQLGRRSCTSKM